MNRARFLGFRFTDRHGNRLDGTPADPAQSRPDEILSVDESLDLAARNPGYWLKFVIGDPHDAGPRAYTDQDDLAGDPCAARS